MKVCFFGCFITDEERMVGIIKGLRMNGVEVVICNDLSSSYLLRYPKLLLKNALLDYDVMFVGWYSQAMVPYARLLTRKPIIIDSYLGLFETSVVDRKLVRSDSLRAKILYCLDKYQFNFGDLAISDTNEHIDYFAKEFNVDKSKFRRILNTTDDEFWKPCNETPDESCFRVKFCGGFIPLQGIEYIIKASKLLENQKDIIFELVGKGQTENSMKELSSQLRLTNVHFKPIWVHYSKIPPVLSNASILLGIFGGGVKSMRVIPSKVVDALALKKPVITEDSPAAREVLEHMENCILVPPENPQAIADAVLMLKDDQKLRNKIAENGYALFQKRLSPKAVGKELKSILVDLVERPS